MKKYKVLFLVNGLSPYRLKFFRELGNYCNLTVVCERKVASNRKWQLDDGKDTNFKLIIMKGLNTSPDSALCPSVVLYLKQTYDLIIVANYSTPTGILAILFLKFFNKNFAIECDGGIVKSGKGAKEKFKKYLISCAKWWFSPSDFSDFYLTFYGAQKESIYRYPFSSVSNNEILEKSLTNLEKQYNKDKLDVGYSKVIISIGQFIHRKGFDLLIRASEHLSEEVGIFIIGGKPTSEYLALINELNLKNVHFHDFMDKELLESYYKMADLFVLPTREDIWGLVINEAMAYGLPIITTKNCVAGLELVKNNENGFIVSINNHLELADNINKVINDDELQNNMSISSLYKISNYTIEKMATNHHDIFEAILK